MRFPHWSFLWEIFGTCIVTAPKTPLTVLLLCIQCSTGCSSWLDHMLLLCSLKVEFYCLVSPLRLTFPDIFHRAIKVSECPFANSLSSEAVRLYWSACFQCDYLLPFLPRPQICVLRPFVLVRIQSCFLLSLFFFCFHNICACFHCLWLFSLCFPLLLLFAAFLGFFSYRLMHFFDIKTKNISKAVSDQ